MEPSSKALRAGQPFFRSPLIVSGAVIAADQLSKILVDKNIPLGRAALSWGGDFFRIIHVRNLGVAFSMGDSLPPLLRKGLFILLPLIVLLLLGIYIIRGKDETLFQKYCLAGILGGGLGNLIDRIFRPQGVVDFLDVKFYGLIGLERWPTFNIADASVVISGALFFLSFIISSKKAPAPKTPKESLNE